MGGSNVSVRISKELDMQIVQIQNTFKSYFGVELSYIEASKALARKTAVYRVPLNDNEIKKVEDFLGRRINLSKRKKRWTFYMQWL